jgi:carotenoid cleavage dioxygenase-like enzyme
MWNFGVDPLRDELTIYRIGPDGSLRESRTISVNRLSPPTTSR